MTDEPQINLLHAEGTPDDEGLLEVPNLPDTIRIWYDEDGRWLGSDEWSRAGDDRLRLVVRGTVRVCETKNVDQMEDEGDY